VSDDAPFPRDDRSWPRAAFAISVVGATVALVGSAALLVKADSPGQMLGLGLTFLVAAGLETTTYVAGVRPWLKGGSIPKHVEVAQIVLVLVAFLALAAAPAVGGAIVCGFFVGAFLPNAGTIRYARLNREMAMRGERHLAEARTGGPKVSVRAAQERSSQGGPADTPQSRLNDAPRDGQEHRQVDAQDGPDEPPEWVSSRPAPMVGRVLRAELVEERGRWLAWAAATAAAMPACAIAGEPDAALYGVGLFGAAALLWVGRRFLGVRQALNDYEKAETEPKRAYVALLNDPKAGAARPLLGVWNAEPLPKGRLPRADAVYRCDEERAALISPPGRVIVHEAWVDTGGRPGSKPQWVVADAGLALPHRSAVLGRWYLASLIGSERPARARPLTVRTPRADTEPAVVSPGTLVSEQPPVFGGWAKLFAFRLAVLLGVALVFVWMT
jgi:hypothetical protein